MDLLSTSSRVAAPIIIVTIGNVTFGLYNKVRSHIEIFGRYYSAIKVDYPNYIRSLQVRKLNGQLNQYTLQLDYAITPGDDPNLIDKILSTVSKSRKITFSYGDATIPSYLYRNEDAIITQVTSSPDVISSKISYTIQATSTALGLHANNFDFPEYYDKPSNIIKDILLTDRKYGLIDIFYGMHDLSTVKQLGLIKSDDREVQIQAKVNISVLDYLKYLVDCMSSYNDENTGIYKKKRYVLTFYDDTQTFLDGPYFKVDTAVTSAPDKTSLATYSIDIGYPTKDFVQSFSINNNQAYSILYDYSQNMSTTDSVYRIGDTGDLIEINSPSLAKSSTLLKTTEANRTWWSNVTQFPIKASLTIKGLLKAILLMSYVEVNVYYYGKKHISSGLYIVNQQDDYIDTTGYRTTLSLIRIQGVNEQ